MRILISKSKLPLSVLIRGVLGSKASHFLIVFDSPGGGLVFESNLLGTHPKFWKTDSSTLTVVDELVVDMTANQENVIWDTVVDKYDGKKYDWGAFFYMGLCYIANRAFKRAIPTKNKWKDDGTFVCLEVSKCLEVYFPQLKDVDVSMMTPDQLMALIKSASPVFPSPPIIEAATP
jgi:hypothetical protein